MTMLAAPARTRADRDVAAFSPAQIEQIRAIVREELAARVRPLPRVDHAVLARLLPALGGAYGSDEWLASEAVQHPALNPVIGGWPAGRLGKLLRRATGVIVNGMRVERMATEAHAIVWRVVGVLPEFQPSGNSGTPTHPRRGGASSPAEEII